VEPTPPPEDDLALLRTAGELLRRIEDITTEQPRLPLPDTEPAVRLRRRTQLAAAVYDPDLAAFFDQAPHLLRVMREALLRADSLHHPNQGRCLQCGQLDPCVTRSHLRRELHPPG
jgi:hypothetical protein